MTAGEMALGGDYIAWVSDKLTVVHLDDIRELAAYSKRNKTSRYITVYDVTNVTTGKKMTFHTTSKFLYRVEDENQNSHGCGHHFCDAIPRSDDDGSRKEAFSEIEKDSGICG